MAGFRHSRALRAVASGLGGTGPVVAACLWAAGAVAQVPAPSQGPSTPSAATPAPVTPVPVTKSGIPAPVIVVVDPQAALQQSKAGQAVRAAHDKYLQGFEAELQAGRKTLSETETDLAKQKATMPFDEWQKKAQAFDQRVVEFNQKFQKINLAVDKSYRVAMTELGQAFTQVTAEIANQMGATLVLPIQQVILHDPRMDLTKAVIERMDARYPFIAFPPPDYNADPGATTGVGTIPGKK